MSNLHQFYESFVPIKQADLTPPLGWMGGRCKVVDRIEDKVRTPGMRNDLAEKVEHGVKLTNPEAAVIYKLETERGAGNFKQLRITPHAQYRMDQRGVTVSDLRVFFTDLTKKINDWKSRGDPQYNRIVQAFSYGEPFEWVDPRVGDLFVVFTVGNGGTVTIITTYFKGEPDPRPGACEDHPQHDKTASKVAERATPGSKGQLSVSQGRFLVWYLPKYADGLQTVLDGLKAAEALYLRAGYRLPDKIPVIMAARGWGSQRSMFTSAAGGYIQMVPSAFADKANFSTFLHELAHYLHFFGLRGGFNNQALVSQFVAMKKEKPTNTGGNGIERAKDGIKAAEREYTKVLASIRPGMKLQVLLPNGIGFNAVETVRPVRVVEKTGRGFNVRVVMEFLEPTPDETAMGVRGNTLPIHVFVKHVADPGLATAFAAAESKRDAAMAAYNESLTQVTDTSRYSDPRSKWFPTDYSKENTQEWFAELVTTRLLVPGSLDPEVTEWLDTVVKTGTAPDAVSRLATRYTNLVGGE